METTIQTDLLESFEILSTDSNSYTMSKTATASMATELIYPWQNLFIENEIEEYASKVGEAIGAKSLEDLKILADNEMMIDEAARLMSMPMIPKVKFKKALSKLKEKDSAVVQNVISPNLGEVSDHESTHLHKQQYQPPAECIAICIDRSYSMKSPFQEHAGWGENASKALENRSRIDAVKQVFYAFRDRTETLGATHRLGLLSFDDKIEVHLSPPTPSLGTFERIIDDVEPRGSTAIYSAIKAAMAMLRPIYEEGQIAQTKGSSNKDGEDNETPDLRILCLTDGVSNAGISPEAALRAANSIDAVVDVILVGDCCPDDSKLRKIVAATGGQCYSIASLSEGFQLMEAESFVSLKARRGGEAKPKRTCLQNFDFCNLEARIITKGTSAQKVATTNTKTTTGSRTITILDSSWPSKAKQRFAATMRPGVMKRIMKELTQFVEEDGSVWTHSLSSLRYGEGVHIFPDQDDLTKIRSIIEGPEGSPFEGGTFVLDVSLPKDYPFKPPKVTFETPIYHCNVSESGGVCMHLLQEGWTPAMSVPKVLELIRLLMMTPEPNNALRQWIAEEVLAYKKHGGSTADGRRYIDNATAHTKRHANRTVIEWMQLWNLCSTKE